MTIKFGVWFFSIDAVPNNENENGGLPEIKNEFKSTNKSLGQRDLNVINKKRATLICRLCR